MPCFLSFRISACALRAAFAAGAALATALSGVPAQAGSVSEGLSDRAAVTLRGRIAPRCALFDMAGRVDFRLAHGSAAKTEILSFTIDCNTPFIYAVSARNGAMQLDRDGGAGDREATRLPYSITLDVRTNEGGALQVECSSESLNSQDSSTGCMTDSGSDVATRQRGEIRVQLPDATQLAEGHYVDNMEITLSVKQ